MKRLFMLPLEPLVERYTGQWYDWLPETFAKAFDVHVIDGQPLTNRIETGAFLDINSSAHWKAVQLAAVARLFHKGEVKNGDCFWVSDIEFWGLESIRYLARTQDINVKIFGFLHAGSYTRGDFMEQMSDLGRLAEPLWIATCDRVYVGSRYHKRAVARRRLDAAQRAGLADRIVATGNPWRTDEARGGCSPLQERDIDVLFPHRPDSEKGIERFLEVLAAMPLREQPWNVSFTTGRSEYRSTNAIGAAKVVISMAAEFDHINLHVGLVRDDFYKLLSRAKVVVSTATEENFGYAMVEAMAMGAYPLMPGCASYPELVQGDSRFLYDERQSASEVALRIDRLVSSYDPDAYVEREAIVKLARYWDGSEQRILDDMMATCG